MPHSRNLMDTPGDSNKHCAAVALPEFSTRACSTVNEERLGSNGKRGPSLFTGLTSCPILPTLLSPAQGEIKKRNCNHLHWPHLLAHLALLAQPAPGSFYGSQAHAGCRSNGRSQRGLHRHTHTSLLIFTAFFDDKTKETVAARLTQDAAGMSGASDACRCTHALLKYSLPSSRACLGLAALHPCPTVPSPALSYRFAQPCPARSTAAQW